ncbi:MAG: phosphoenolpyruvate carboxykinase [Anaerolineaceae bacterium]
MDSSTFQAIDGKIILRLRDRICDTPEELLSSEQFKKILGQFITNLVQKNSNLLGVFCGVKIDANSIKILNETLIYLTRLPANLVEKVVDGSDQFFADKELFNSFIEQLYNYWRHFQRLIISESRGEGFENRPYRTFNRTIEHLTTLIRNTYRDIQSNITGIYPRIYRQVSAGAEIAAITEIKNIAYSDELSEVASDISIIRQVLIYPPIIFKTTSNKRVGFFERVANNPINKLQLNNHEWLCYPAKVGELLVMVYFSLELFELSFALCNLFELANDEDLKRKPDAVVFFGVPVDQIEPDKRDKTFFFDDDSNGTLIGIIPEGDEMGYFGYLKKMTLTLHNIKMMKKGIMPYHGAMFQLKIRGKGEFNFLIMGDTGAGKSETLEAMRAIGGDKIEDISIIADDMGSLKIDPNGDILGYGTETGAFVRLDDLQPGYAFGQIDRAIIMNANQVNARVVLPVTTYEKITRGTRVDYVFYANNYEIVDGDHPVIGRFNTKEDALEVFRRGRVMSKGTTNTSGIVGTYFANVFGPQQYPELYDEISERFFSQMFSEKIYVGQIRTQLGVPGMERSGPEIAAKAILDLFK